MWVWTSGHSWDQPNSPHCTGSGLKACPSRSFLPVVLRSSNLFPRAASPSDGREGGSRATSQGTAGLGELWDAAAVRADQDVSHPGRDRAGSACAEGHEPKGHAEGIQGQTGRAKIPRGAESTEGRGRSLRSHVPAPGAACPVRGHSHACSWSHRSTQGRSTLTSPA